MTTVDIHAHYVSPHLIDEAKRRSSDLGVGIEMLEDGRERLIFDQSGLKLRPFFAELCDLPLRELRLREDGIDLQLVSTWGNACTLLGRVA